MVRRILWIAIVPLALTCLLAEPGGRAQEPDESDVTVEALEPVEPGFEHIKNPIQNWGRFDYRSHQKPPPYSMMLLNFAALVVLVWRTGWPSVKRVVRERHEAIASALAESARLRDQARARLDEYDAKLAGLEGEIDALVSGIRAEADAEKKRIIADAEARAERMQRDAEQQIQAEIQRVRAALEREAVAAAIGIAEQMLRDKTGDADQRALADRFVRGLNAASGRRAPA